MFRKSFAVTQDTAVRTDRNGTVVWKEEEVGVPSRASHRIFTVAVIEKRP
jgi:hypothetical protein